MRKQYTEVLKTFFHKEVHTRRKSLGISQEEMAYKLAMGCRSYAKIDKGYICCSALTLVLYLIYICEDHSVFLHKLRHAFENSTSDAA